jgi:hypothetical protein
MERNKADLNGSKPKGASPKHGVRHATQSALLISCDLDLRSCCEDMLEDDVVDDNVMGKFHVDARYTKRTSEAAYQFIRTDDVPESNHIYGTGALSVRVSFGNLYTFSVPLVTLEYISFQTGGR